jgi:hypothetical protein
MLTTAMHLLASTARSQDFDGIPRQIHNHPNWQSGQPRFALLVFGPHAKARAWLVIDGDHMYLDRNGDSDLSEPNERFDLEVTHFTKEVRDDAKTLKRIHLHDPKQRPNPNDDQPILTCEPRVTWFHVLHIVPREGSYQVERWPDNKFQVAIFANGANEFARADFGDSPGEAAIISFLGRRTFRHDHGDQPALRRGETNYLTVGICGEGLRSKTAVDHDSVPAEIHPIADLECPSRYPGRPPIRIRVELTERC